MAAPTRVSYSVPASNFTTGTTKTSASFNVSSGDILTVVAMGENELATLGTPTASGGSVTWTLRQSVVVTNFASAYVWTGAVGATATGITVTVTCSAGLNYGFGVTCWRGSGGVGVSGKGNSATGNPSVTLACGANSAIDMGVGDWNANTGAATYNSINGSAMTQATLAQPAAVASYYIAYAPDTGASGNETPGMTAPTGMTWSIVSVEITGASGTNYTPSAADSGAGSDSTSFIQSQQQTLADTGAGTDSTSPVQQNVRSAADSGAGSDSVGSSIGYVRTAADSGTGTDSILSVANVVQALADTGSGTDAASTVAASVRAVSDSGVGTDSTSFVQSQAQTIADSGSGTDSASAVLNGGGTNYTPSAADTGAGSDAVTFVQSQAQTIADSGSGTDSAQTQRSVILAPQDTGAGSDSLATRVDVVRSIADTGSGSDALSTSAAYVQLVADTGAGSDSVGYSAAYARAIADTGAGSDVGNAVLGSQLRNLMLSGVPLGTRWASAEILARWLASANSSRWSTLEWARWSSTPLTARFATGLDIGDTMSLDVIISSGAAVYVGGTVTETTGKDISADTFMISLGSDQNPGTWLTPDVSIAGTSNAQRIVKLLVSPTVPANLAKGTYWVWVKISDSPEIQPLRVQGPVNVR